ncbi:MAG: trypsin-like peptidase domain-containing protein [Verrucomicrobiales bacterium]|nr:trypsin-like peptidase domain-containing protein [Verrucomicrobiales bacterium]
MTARTLLPTLAVILTPLSHLAAQQATPGNGNRFGNIVRIEAAAANPDYRTPWNPPRPSGGSGTGFLVGPNQFLTNAHVVSNASRVIIKKVGDPQPYPAIVKHIAHDCDLAMLELEDASPFSNVPYLEIGDLPKLDTAVTVVGYPIGGERISVTRGIVSRIDFQPYSHSGVDNHLTIQIDAAINPGNSGGPVIQDGKVAGVAFQGYSGTVAQNVGYMIPTPVIERFRKDVEDGSYDKYVDLNIADFALVNPAQRKALGLPAQYDGQGVMVGAVDNEGSTAGLIEIGDVLLAIDGNPIASNGFINLNGERVNMNEIVERKFAGDKINLSVWRDGAEKTFEISLIPFVPYLITANKYGERPEYIVYAGLVFQPLNRNLMMSHGIQNETVRYWFGEFVGEQLYKERPQPVIFTTVLPDAVNTHIAGYVHSLVDTVNGTKITTMKDMLSALSAAEKSDSDFITVQLLNEGRPLVLDKSIVTEANTRISSTYGITTPFYVED